MRRKKWNWWPTTSRGTATLIILIAALVAIIISNRVYATGLVLERDMTGSATGGATFRMLWDFDTSDGVDRISIRAPFPTMGSDFLFTSCTYSLSISTSLDSSYVVDDRD